MSSRAPNQIHSTTSKFNVKPPKEQPISPKEKVRILINKLSKMYPNPKTPLYHEGVFQLLIAVILSAQMQDERLNKVLPTLFKEYPNPQELAQADLKRLLNILKPVNYYKTKAKHIKQTSEILVKQFKGKVPNTLDKLIKLPGVGRKTANVVLSEGFNTPQGIVVDTHVKRLSQRLGLTTHNDPIKIEDNLKRLVPRQYWRQFSLWLIYYGRQVCTAKSPKCHRCPFQNICNFYAQNINSGKTTPKMANTKTPKKETNE